MKDGMPCELAEMVENIKAYYKNEIDKIREIETNNRR